MKKIIFATGNANKMVEVRMILADCGYEIVSMKEAGIDIDIVEDGKTFEENAIIKATAISKTKEAEGCVVLADDSGLEVDYMDGAPGIYSARWQGEDTPYSIKNQMIIDALADAKEEERTARFVCAIAAAFPDGTVTTRRGVIEGMIAHQPAGNMDLAMIRSSSCRNMERRPRSWHRRIRTRSAIGDVRWKRFARYCS